MEIFALYIKLSHSVLVTLKFILSVFRPVSLNLRKFNFELINIHYSYLSMFMLTHFDDDLITYENQYQIMVEKMIHTKS